MLESTLARHPRDLPRLLAAAILFLAFTAGCGQNKMTAPSSQVPLTLRAGAVGLGYGSTTRTSAALADTVPVTYTKVLLVVREVRFRLAENEPEDSLDADGEHDDMRLANFEGISGDSMEQGDGDHEGEHEGEGHDAVVFHGPFVIDLLAQSAESLDTEMVPPGKYRSTKGSIGPLRADDWNASHFPTLVGSTVYLQGTVDGEGGGSFTYQAPIRHTFKIKGNFTVEASTPATAFLTFDTSHWLQDREGNFLDPRDPANDWAIRLAIIRSIRAGMDDNHDGKCDDRTHGEDD
jgi:hypothetical protein